MKHSELVLSKIFFSYLSSSEPVISDITVSFTHGWTGIVGANGAGKTTLMNIATGTLAPTKGLVDRPPLCLYCPQRTDDPPEHLKGFLEDWEPDACRLRGTLGVEYDWLDRWNTLSHGERKRAQIAVALWKDPDALAIDEPTNHLDMEARAMLRTALKRFKGIGLIVSHDRELLDFLCRSCFFLDGGVGILRPGGISKGILEEERENMEARRLREEARTEMKRLEVEASKRRALAASQQKRRSKKGIPLKDHDARYKKNIARISGKDGVGGKLLRQMDGRIKQAEDKFQGIKASFKQTTGITVRGARSRSDALMRMDSELISLGNAKLLKIPELEILPSDRIAFVGPNGSGKSTMVRKIVAALGPLGDRMTYVPQEIDLSASEALRSTIRELPSQIRGNVMSAVSRLGSRPERVLESAVFSPGEARKVMLALGLGSLPHLIIMDEPTNHMDLPSIRCVEEALKDAECSLLLVSHDTAFTNALTDTTWSIQREKKEGDIETFLLTVEK